MEVKIEWSELSQRQLRDIYDYYAFKANPEVAHRIIDKIVIKPLVLLKYPNLGQKEDLLEHSTKEFHYLVEGNYKIIYWFERGLIKIAAVFDCRQNPDKLKKTKA